MALSILGTKTLHSYTYILVPDIFHRSPNCFSLLSIPSNLILKLLAVSPAAYVHDPGILLLRWFLFPSIRRVFLISFRFPAAFLHKTLSFDISAQTLYDICNSISYVIDYLRLPFLDDLLLLSLAVARPQVHYTTKGGFLSSLSPIGFFSTTRLASGFLHTKKGCPDGHPFFKWIKISFLLDVWITSLY